MHAFLEIAVKVFCPEDSFDHGLKKFSKLVLDSFYILDGWLEQELGVNQNSERFEDTIDDPLVVSRAIHKRHSLFRKKHAKNLLFHLTQEL